MKVIDTSIKGVLILEPDIFKDKRGYFLETYQEKKYGDLGISDDFVQDNLSLSVFGTLRGLHFQNPHGQAKLVQVIQGEVFDVAVDIRKGSPTFGQHVSVVLTGDNKRQFLVPKGFAHGFCVTSETAIFTYKCSEYYSPRDEKGILWSDPEIGIQWPIDQPVLSEKDGKYPCLKEVPRAGLPEYQV
jgi:dTDP-4-dehydrorhamnose 3,5-epimerase